MKHVSNIQALQKKKNKIKQNKTKAKKNQIHLFHV
jgi:hypothetical protein